MTQARISIAILAAAAAVVLGSLWLTPAPGGAAGVPVSAIAAGPTLEAHLEYSHLLRGVTETHLAVTVVAPEHAGAATRPQLSVSVVLDRSGSMRGDKLAQAKRAAAELVGALAATDRIALVAYGSEVETLFPMTAATTTAKAAAIAAIERLEFGGGTNLSGGLLAGRDQLAGDIAGVRRVVLISDGKATEGIVYGDALATLARETAERGVSVTTVGIGVDFDERKLSAIAVAGRGNYYYAERATDLSAMFATELDRLGATTATDLSVELAAAPGVEVIEVYGYAGSSNRIEVADLHAGEQRKVVFRIRVRQTESGTFEIGAVRLRFTDPNARTTGEQSVRVSAIATDDHHEVAAGQHAGAVRLVERAQTARALERATELYEEGELGRARQVIETRRRAASRRAGEIGDATLAREIDAVAGEAAANFEAPAPASPKGKAGRKRNRKSAYELLY